MRECGVFIAKEQFEVRELQRAAISVEGSQLKLAQLDTRLVVVVRRQQ
jgi:hypothetical protein